MPAVVQTQSGRIALHLQVEAAGKADDLVEEAQRVARPAQGRQHPPLGPGDVDALDGRVVGQDQAAVGSEADVDLGRPHPLQGRHHRRQRVLGMPTGVPPVPHYPGSPPGEEARSANSRGIRCTGHPGRVPFRSSPSRRPPSVERACEPAHNGPAHEGGPGGVPTAGSKVTSDRSQGELKPCR